jgi:hypothetical protein
MPVHRFGHAEGLKVHLLQALEGLLVKACQALAPQL